MAGEVLRRIQVNIREGDEPACWCEHAIGYQGLQVGLELMHSLARLGHVWDAQIDFLARP